MERVTFTVALIPDALGRECINLQSGLYGDTRRKPVHMLPLIDIDQPPERIPALAAKIDTVAEAYSSTPLFIGFRTFTWDGKKRVYWEAEREALVRNDAWWELHRVLFNDEATRIVNIPPELAQIVTGRALEPISQEARRSVLEIQLPRMLIARRATLKRPVFDIGPLPTIFRFPNLALLEMSTRGNVKRIVRQVAIGRMTSE